MDYREYLLTPLSKLYIDKLVLQVIDEPVRFDELFQLIYDSNEKIAWRAAWACHKISEKRPAWFSDEKITTLISFLLLTRHDGVLRGCMSILNQVDFRKSITVDLINFCYDRMLSPSSSIAVQALSMKILYKICIVEPDLKTELLAYLENIDIECYSKGFQSTRKNILKALIHK